VFGGSGEGVPTVEITKEDGNDILSLLVKSGLCASKSDARRNVQQGGVTANDSKVTDIAKTFTEAELRDGVVLKRGKKNFRKMLLK
jgi:tyrosyl-tRNA synthetase